MSSAAPVKSAAAAKRVTKKEDVAVPVAAVAQQSAPVAAPAAADRKSVV
jgi:hypothetical protein